MMLIAVGSAPRRSTFSLDPYSFSHPLWLISLLACWLVSLLACWLVGLLALLDQTSAAAFLTVHENVYLDEQ
jgi:hypothetical protein